MTDVLAVWLVMLGTVSLACNLAYICRDMVREYLARRAWEKRIKANRDETFRMLKRGK